MSSDVPAPRFAMLGDGEAPVCEDGICVLPDAAAQGPDADDHEPPGPTSVR